MKAKILVYALPALILATIHLAEAQQPKKVPRIGVLIALSPSAISDRTEAFRQGLRELGYLEGKDIVIEYRSAEGKFDRLPHLAAELVRLKVDVIVTGGPTATRPAKEATNTIPIVMVQDSDPVGKRVHRQPCESWREHYWIGNAFFGTKRRTTGASKGDYSQGL
jgi:putative ABC transport system substrate-binding protein